MAEWFFWPWCKLSAPSSSLHPLHRSATTTRGSTRAWWILPSCLRRKGTTTCRCPAKLSSETQRHDDLITHGAAYWFETSNLTSWDVPERRRRLGAHSDLHLLNKPPYWFRRNVCSQPYLGQRLNHLTWNPLGCCRATSFLSQLQAAPRLLYLTWIWPCM